MSIEDLLIEFDEMSFYPGTTVPNPDEYARDYKERLAKAFYEKETETKRRAQRLANKSILSLSNQFKAERESLQNRIAGLEKQLDEKCDICIDRDIKTTAKDIITELLKNTIPTFDKEGKPIIKLNADFALNMCKKYGVNIEQ